MRPCVHSYDEQTAQYRVHVQKRFFSQGFRQYFICNGNTINSPLAGESYRIFLLAMSRGCKGVISYNQQWELNTFEFRREGSPHGGAIFEKKY